MLIQWQVDDTPWGEYMDGHDFWEQAVDLQAIPSDEYVEGGLEIWRKVEF